MNARILPARILPARILIVEDESTLAEMLEFNLNAEGYTVSVATDGELALEQWRHEKPDLVLLDVMLPKRSGYDVCRQARLEGLRTGVLFLSAKGEANDRITGLEAGGDDYLGKPFHLRELLLRIATILRRQTWFTAVLEPDRKNTFEFAGHQIDFAAWTIHLANGQLETLGERETMILKLFVENPNRVVPRNEILDRIWGEDSYPSSRTVDNFIVRLRRILEPDPSAPKYLHTVWGVGYRFTPEGKASEK
jgi:two-component system, OmpR family, alkaline phosphatase synthesis response regulator PhoP